MKALTLKTIPRWGSSSPTCDLKLTYSEPDEFVTNFSEITSPVQGKIRRGALSEGPQIHEAHMASIRDICSKHYSKKDIEAWGNRPYDSEVRNRALKDDYVWVVEKNDHIEGYGHLKIIQENGHEIGRMSGLFLTTKVYRRYFGRALVEVMFEVCSQRHIPYMTLDSTVTALEFYKKFGFLSNGEGKYENFAGANILCFPLIKHFT